MGGMFEWITIIGGSIVGILTLIGMFFGIRQTGVDAQKAKDQEAQLEQANKVGERVTDAQNAGNVTSLDLRQHPDRLREDDGFRRD